MKNYWLSWNSAGPYTLHWPWWITGQIGTAQERYTICAAVRAFSEDHAKAVIRAAHDNYPIDLDWRFCIERPEDWTPFGDRFPRADWMQWPTDLLTNFEE